MTYVTSPMACHAGVKCLLIHRMSEWYSLGQREWSSMMGRLTRLPATQRVMGLDIEWVGSGPPALVQLASATHCFLFHLAFFEDRRLPEAVQEVLHDMSIIKCGVGIGEDAERILYSGNGVVLTLLPVEVYATYLKLNDGAACGLKSMSRTVLQFPMHKSWRISRSDWEHELSVAQVSYAVDDAVASMLLGKRVMTHAVETGALRDDEIASGDIPGWLRRTASLAKGEFKQAQRIHNATRQLLAQMKAIRYVSDTSSDVSNAAGERTLNGTPVAVNQSILLPQRSHEVTVLDADGVELMRCSRALAKRFVRLDQVAFVKESVMEKRKRKKSLRSRPRVIQLRRDTQLKTRLCQLHLLGCCPFAAKCPYAHDESALIAVNDSAAAETQNDTQKEKGVVHGKEPTTTTKTKHQDPTCAALPSATRCCVYCKETYTLSAYAIVPSVLRTQLPAPWQQAQSPAREKVTICFACRGLVQQRYGEEMKRLHCEANATLPYTLKMSTISRCIRLARQLLNRAQCAHITASALSEKHRYIRRNWRPEFFVKGGTCDGDELDAESDTPLGVDYLRRIRNESAGRTCHTLMMRALVGQDAEKARQFVQRWRDLGVELKLLPPEKAQNESASGEEEGEEEEEDVPSRVTDDN